MRVISAPSDISDEAREYLEDAVSNVLASQEFADWPRRRIGRSFRETPLPLGTPMQNQINTMQELVPQLAEKD